MTSLIITLKISGGFTFIVNYFLNNEFTYLIISDDVLTEGNYTFWQNELQLSGNKVNIEQNGIPNGERPQRPNGNTPQKPSGDVPEPPNGERPEPPNGERPEPPNGFEDNYNAAVSKTFTITKGENQFTNVSLSN